MNEFITIEGSFVSTIVIDKSKFICSAKNVKTVDEAEQFLEQVRKEHYKATHNVPVYIVKDGYRYSDDGEPAGTAGLPVLDMLQKEGYRDVAMVITRYFGGIKLGTGGLVRAYTQSAKETIKESKIMKVKQLTELTFSIDYTFHPKLMNLISNSEIQITATNYSDMVELVLWLETDKADVFKTSVMDLTNGSVIIKSETFKTVCLDLKSNKPNQGNNHYREYL